MKKVLCAMIAAKIVQIYHFLASCVKLLSKNFSTFPVLYSRFCFIMDALRNS